MWLHFDRILCHYSWPEVTEGSCCLGRSREVQKWVIAKGTRKLWDDGFVPCFDCSDGCMDAYTCQPYQAQSFVYPLCLIKGRMAAA